MEKTWENVQEDILTEKGGGDGNPESVRVLLDGSLEMGRTLPENNGKNTIRSACTDKEINFNVRVKRPSVGSRKRLEKFLADRQRKALEVHDQFYMNHFIYIEDIDSIQASTRNWDWLKGRL